jgi:hypothetical protein
VANAPETPQQREEWENEQNSKECHASLLGCHMANGIPNMYKLNIYSVHLLYIKVTSEPDLKVDPNMAVAE